MLENHCLLFLTNLPWVIQGQTAQFILKILKFKQVLLPVFGLVLKPSSDPPDTVLEYHQQFFKIIQNNVHLSFILKVFIQPSLCARHCRFHNERNLIPWAHWSYWYCPSVLTTVFFLKWEDIKQHFWKQKIKLSHTLPSPNTMFFLICFPPIFVFMHAYFINL